MSETKHTPFVRWIFQPEDHGYWILELVIRPKETVTLLTTSEEYGCLAETTRNKIATSVNARPKVEELVRMIKKSAEVAASKQNRQEAAAVVLDLVLPHLGDKAREVEAALGGKAE